jgi:leucyl-tRNA synthetase
MMELVNELYAFSESTPHGVPGRTESTASSDLTLRERAVVREALDALVVMLSPFAPHTAEELWQMLGHRDGLTKTAWPQFDAAVAKAEEVVVPVQVNGKIRARVTVPADLEDETLRARVLTDPAVQAHTEGKTIRKVVVAKGPLVSVVVS